MITYFIDGNTAEDAALREAAAIEFRQFYDEMKKAKNGSTNAMEYFSQCEFEKTQTRLQSLCSSTRLQRRRSRHQQSKSSGERRRCSQRKHRDIELSCTIDV